MAVEFQVARRGKDSAGGGDAFADEFGGNAAAFIVVLTDEAESVGAGRSLLKVMTGMSFG
ncbi:hypothetical protein LC724_31420 [Blautia sp. RD014234]|nr:hypothetical protein [Blautia parvula]